VHGIPGQQSAFVRQIWPYCPQVPESLGGGGGGIPPSYGPPPSDGGGGGGGPPPSPALPPQGPQTPCAVPPATMQQVPGQQSAVLVHRPHAAMHCVPAQT